MNTTKIALVAMMSLISGAAFAADLPAEKGPPSFVPPPPPPPTWTGFYVGVNGGYGGGQFTYPFNATTGAGASIVNGNANITSSGGLAGGQIGFNYQFPGSNFVAGVEADADWTNVRGNLGINVNTPGGSFNANAGSQLEYLGTARARLGYAWNNIMPYVTGGFAYGEDKSYVSAAFTPGPGIALSKFNNHDGWTVGGGVEYKITPNLSFKTEYLYVNLGSRSLLNFNSGQRGGFSLREDPTVNIVRAGLNYTFDWFAPPAPVVAKY